jgi:hypothetical protein
LSRVNWSEDLIQQAIRGLELGREFCTCEGYYHILWGPLRAAGFLGSLTIEEPALAGVLAPLIQDGTEILIGGSADPGTLALVGRVSGKSRPRLSLIDRCKAPIRLIREFCAARHIQCETFQGDLLEVAAFGRWDITILNYTHTFIDSRVRILFFEQIACALKSGGRVVCLAKVGARQEDENIGKLQAAWLTRAREALITSGLMREWDEGKIESMLSAAAFARTERRMNLMSAEDLKSALVCSGLRLAGEHLTPRTWGLTTSDVVDVEGSVVLTAQKP